MTFHRYKANENQTQFSYAFFAPANTDLLVKTGESYETLQNKTLTTDYTVERNENGVGGYVIFTTAVTKGYKVQIESNLTIERTTSFADLTDPEDLIPAFNAEMLKLNYIFRFIESKFNARVKVARDSRDLDTTIPSITGNTNLGLQWTETNLGFQSVPIEIDLKSYNYTLLDVKFEEPISNIDTKEYTYALLDVIPIEVVPMTTKAYNYTTNAVLVNETFDLDLKEYDYALYDPAVLSEQTVTVDTEAYTYSLKDITLLESQIIDIDTKEYTYSTPDPTYDPLWTASGDSLNGTQADQDSSGDIDWDTPNRAIASDNSYVQAVDQTWTYSGVGYSEDTNVLYVYDFEAEIPDAAVIIGIKILFEGWAGGPPGTSTFLEWRIKDCMLLDTGVLYTGSSALTVEQALTTIDSSYEFGSAVTMSVWGSPSLTGADIKDENFGIGIYGSLYNTDAGESGSFSASNWGFFCDNLRVMFYYDDTGLDTT